MSETPDPRSTPTTRPPGYAGYRLIKITDNEWSQDRYLFAFSDRTALVVDVDGRHSTWLDEDPKGREAWNPGRILTWSQVPPTVAATVARRCRELHDILIHNRWPTDAP